MHILTRLNKVIEYSERGYVPVGNSAISTFNNKRYDDALIVEVDCVPTDIDQYDYYYIDGKFIKGDAKPKPFVGVALWEGILDSSDTVGVEVPDIEQYRVVLLDGINFMPCICTIHMEERFPVEGMGGAMEEYAYRYIIRGITQYNGPYDADGRSFVSISLISSFDNPTEFKFATDSCVSYSISSNGTLHDDDISNWSVMRIIGIC